MFIISIFDSKKVLCYNQKEAFNRTFETVTKQLTEDSKKIIAETYGDVETYLANKIEQFVEELKNK